MKQILTIAEQSTQKFDETVNLAFEQGWELTKRYYTPDNFFVAELEREVITEAERCCENCRYFDTSPGLEPCFSCEDGETAPTNWEVSNA